MVDFAAAHGLVSIIDNTFASPMNFRPAEIGFDLSVHSCTKYLNGHSDIVAGAIIGRAELVAEVTHKLNHLGGVLDPHACFLLHRGMKTLAVRVRYQNESALKIARFLEGHPASRAGQLPGLESPRTSACLRTARRLRRDAELRTGGRRRRRRRFHRPRDDANLGAQPGRSREPDHAARDDFALGYDVRGALARRNRDGLVRFSVGLESTDDLIEDFEARSAADAIQIFRRPHQSVWDTCRDTLTFRRPQPTSAHDSECLRCSPRALDLLGSCP